MKNIDNRILKLEAKILENLNAGDKEKQALILLGFLSEDELEKVKTARKNEINDLLDHLFEKYAEEMKTKVLYPSDLMKWNLLGEYSTYKLKKIISGDVKACAEFDEKLKQLLKSKGY